VLLVCLVGSVVIIAYAVLALIQILVLNPQAAVPGMSLDEIWQEVFRSQGIADPFVVTLVLALGPLLAIGLTVCAMVWLRRRPWVVVACFLALLVLGTPAYVVASFSPGMNLADTFGIDGADYSPWAEPLFVTSAIALTGLAALGVGSILRATLRGAPRSAPLDP
jgi:hypothetical protein